MVYPVKPLDEGQPASGVTFGPLGSLSNVPALPALCLVPDLAPIEEKDAEGGLLEAARAGEVRALRSLYETNAPIVARFLRGLLRDPTQAADALQETFARALRRLDTLAEADRLLPWLFGIARHVALEHYRAGRRAGALAESSEPERRHDLTPEVALLGQEAARVVELALAKMGEGRRAALLLRIDHGLSYQEIAETLGWSLAKAKVEVHRGREVLRAELAAYGGGGR